MKSLIAKVAIISMIALTIAVPISSYAEESGMREPVGQAMEIQGKVVHMCPMHGMMMMRMMLEKTMVSSGDGGVIVMTGNKLLKYDKDLNLVNESDIKVDITGAEKMMGEMTARCPMCQKMMHDSGAVSMEPIKAEETQ